MIAAAIVMAAVAVYGFTQRPASRVLRVYLQCAEVLLAAVVASGLLGAAGVVQAGWLFGGLIIALVLLVPAGLVFLARIDRQEQRQAHLLRAAATLLMPTSDLHVLLNQVLDIAQAAVHVDSSSIMLLNPETRELRFAATRGLDPSRTGAYHLSLDHPTIAALWPGRGPLIVPDVDKVPAFRQLLVRKDLRSFFGIPMVTRDTLVGFLNVHRTRPSTLKQEEIELLTALASQAAVAINTSRLYADLQRRYLDTISALASAIEVKDPQTLGHSRRVAAICRLLAAEMDLDAATRETLEVTALLHDIGKIGISGTLLSKLGALSPEERTEVRSHPMLGTLVLREVKALHEVLPSVLHHHERWDGTGYPYGLRGEAIPLPARIVAVADAYEVMTAGRSYRKARSPEMAIAEIKREAGRQFDPAVVDALVKLYEQGKLPDVEGLGEPVGEPSQSAAS